MMTKYHLLYVALFLGLIASCTSINKDPESSEPQLVIDVGMQESEIKNLILMESRFLQEGRFDKWINCFTQDDKTSFLQAPPGDFGIPVSLSGIHRLEEAGQDYLSAQSRLNIEVLDRSDWKISIKGDMGWVRFKQETSIDGSSFHSEEVRVVEKVDGDWKIALFATLL